MQTCTAAEITSLPLSPVPGSPATAPWSARNGRLRFIRSFARASRDVRNGHPYSDGKWTYFHKDRLFEAIAEDYPEMVAEWSVRYREKLLRQLSVFPTLLPAMDERGRTGNLRCVRTRTQDGALLETEFLSPEEAKAQLEHEQRVQELTEEQVEAIKGALAEARMMPGGAERMSSFADGIEWLDRGRPLLMPAATPEVRRIEQVEAAKLEHARAKEIAAERRRVRREQAERADKAKRIAQLEAMRSWDAPPSQDDDDTPIPV